MAVVTTDSLIKEYPGGVRGVDGIDVTIRDGEFFALLGPSGCGKTTLLRTIAGLEKTTSGTITIGDRDVTRLEPGQRNVAMVFQDYALFPHMAVVDNIAYPLKIQKVAKRERRTKASEVGDGLSLDGLMDRRPAQLSGGQQQRVALARAVASRPDVFLFDEPLSNLDARLRLEARTFLKRLQKDLGVTTLFVTHDQAEALALADRIAIMKAGRLQQLGTPREIFRRPANTFVASFVGSTPMNLARGVVAGDTVRLPGGWVPLPEASTGRVSEGQEVTWGIRPEYLELAGDDREALTGTVTISENLGASVLITVDIGENLVQIVLDEDDEPRIGDSVRLAASARRSLVFDAEGDLIANETAEPVSEASR